MTEDETRIRDLVERWTRAVRAGDLAGVLADHAEDIVMYDVPPPCQGVRGIEAYARSWPAFFEWQAAGATFELAELDITAGETVAYAHALLRCGTPADLARKPEFLLRLTLGLRKEDGRWVVAHEHHSFPDDSGSAREVSEREVRALHQRWFDATAAKDLDGLMRPVAEAVVPYEHEQPLEHVGRDRLREVCANGLDASDGTVTWTVPELTLLVRDDLAVSWGLNRMTAQHGNGGEAESWSRGTRVFQRTDQGWELIHQHVSFPFDPDTGRARTDLAPDAAVPTR
ncbi:SgcJ/EcaC family oxidoreductase [Micromonospora sp. WMMD812]|uniref:YybH family protein n=1 Tax=Micromonospora sp. WMMD812 TaxID=3015152 RepID=UPI00248ADDA3|nr:SgcJ/EcaC family oxidoreductase [Micromonospora sp. WMMD812]WBB68297.1 SgcJ/EcaC family oxidoreductase [Micromonospora sp. WMMD812]